MATDILQTVLNEINKELKKADEMASSASSLIILRDRLVRYRRALAMREVLEELALGLRDEFGDERFLQIEGGFRQTSKERKWYSAELYQERLNNERESGW
ncbi:hypothetical protein HY045_03360 [Candidatus Woesebacteria bacterium]|nr:hypothetical protein [Candidatus Woesebacteria bacterium]